MYQDVPKNNGASPKGSKQSHVMNRLGFFKGYSGYRVNKRIRDLRPPLMAVFGLPLPPRNWLKDEEFCINDEGSAAQRDL